MMSESVRLPATLLPAVCYGMPAGRVVLVEPQGLRAVRVWLADPQPHEKPWTMLLWLPIQAPPEDAALIGVVKWADGLSATVYREDAA